MSDVVIIVRKIIEDLMFLQNKAEDPLVKIAYGMAITICKLHLKDNLK